MYQNIRNDANALAKHLHSTAEQIESYENLKLSDRRTWYLLIAPLIGETRQKLEQLESEIIEGATIEDTPAEMLAPHLKRSMPTMYRRIREARERIAESEQSA